MKTLSKDIGTGRQSVIFKETLEYKGDKIRVEIKSDSYDFQSYARVSVFHDMKWNRIDSIHFSSMKTRDELAYGPRPATVSDFKADRDELIKLAKDVI